MIKDTPLSERPREKALAKGIKSLSDAELLAIILKTGTKKRSVTDLAFDLLNHYQDLSYLANEEINELKKFKGIGKVKALELVCCFELGKRMQNRQVVMIRNAQDVYNLFYSKIADAEQEELHGIFLNNKKKILGTKLIFKGTVNQSSIYPRDIFREALKLNAVSIILVHNHPSGDVTPSKADIEMTRVLVKIGHELGIKVIDHIIVGYNTYYSFYDNKWWESYEKKLC